MIISHYLFVDILIFFFNVACHQWMKLPDSEVMIDITRRGSDCGDYAFGAKEEQVSVTAQSNILQLDCFEDNRNC